MSEDRRDPPGEPAASAPGGPAGVPTPTGPVEPRLLSPTATGAPGDPVAEVPPRERVRRLFVTGAAASVEAAAMAVGANPRTARDWATAEGWREERRRYLEDERRKLYAESQEGEVQNQGTARRIAWQAARRALERVRDKIDGGAAPTPFEAESLARTALALSGVGDMSADDELEKLRPIPLPELAGKLSKALAGLGVPLDELEALKAGEAPAPAAVNGSAGNGKAT